ncbi:MAG: cbb3-type cytochrome c oxidase subunit I, partial [Solirubrobacteraceae bacterium]
GRMYHEGWGQFSFWCTFVGTLVTFFPMHIVGLMGMVRRNYTYPAGLGFSTLNALETVGAFVLAAGLISIVLNLLISYFKGVPAGNDPWEGDTLEWSTTSPPPPYNYPVIPTVTSPYAMWDTNDRELDNKRLERGEGVFALGHRTPGSTVQDAEVDELLEMPSHSIWPPLSALALAGVFAMLLLQHYFIALGFAAVIALTLIGWHRHGTEP